MFRKRICLVSNSQRAPWPQIYRNKLPNSNTIQNRKQDACFLPSVQFPLTPRNPYNQVLLNSKNLNLHNLLAVFKAHVLAWFILAPIKMQWKSYYHHRLYKLLYVTDENWRLTEVKWLTQRHRACLELNPSLTQSLSPHYITANCLRDQPKPLSTPGDTWMLDVMSIAMLTQPSFILLLV